MFKPILVLLVLLLGCSATDEVCDKDITDITYYGALIPCKKQQNCPFNQVCVPLKAANSVSTFCVDRNLKATIGLEATCKENKDCSTFYCVKAKVDHCLNMCSVTADCSLGNFCRLARVEVQDFYTVIGTCLPY